MTEQAAGRGTVAAVLSPWRIGVAVLAVVAIALSLRGLATPPSVSVDPIVIGDAPATLYAPATGERTPTVVVAHGFSGSQQLMRTIGVALAERGYQAITFDFLGHGRRAQPLTGDVTRVDGATEALIDDVRRAVAVARERGDGRVALLGHSMAADIVVRTAQRDASIDPTIAVSIFSPAPTDASPRNLLIVTGAQEAALRGEALRIVGLATAEPVEGSTYVAEEAGRRRAAVAPGVEHIGVLYSAATVAEAVAWLDEAYDRPPADANGDPLVASHYGPWLLTLMAGVVALAWPLAALLPRASRFDLEADADWGAFLAVAAFPAIATPLILRVAKVEILPVLVADYLAQHFALYGVLTLLGLWVLRRRRPSATAPLLAPSAPASTLAAAAVALYAIIALGSAVDAYGTSFVVTPERAPLFVAMAFGALLYFIADERLTRGVGRRRTASYAIAKLLFVGSLAAAVALDLERLFFLIIIAPIILACFAVFGLFGAWTLRRTGDPWVAGAGVGIAVAYAIAATFPIVEG